MEALPGYGWFGWDLYILAIWPWVGITLKRLHDIGKFIKAFWWMLGLMFAMYLLMGIEAFLGHQNEALSILAVVIGLPFVVLAIWLMIAVCFFKGEPDHNRYGPALRTAHDRGGAELSLEDAKTANTKIVQKARAFWNTDFLLSFDGRVTRYDFWVRYMLPVFAIPFPLEYVDKLAGWMYVLDEDFELGLLSTTFSIVFIWPGAAITAKRLHDRKYSGWWQVLPFALMIIAAFLAFVSPVLCMIVAVPAAISFIWFIVETGFLRGTRGENEYGADPLENRDEIGNLPPPSDAV